MTTPIKIAIGALALGVIALGAFSIRGNVLAKRAEAKVQEAEKHRQEAEAHAKQAEIIDSQVPYLQQANASQAAEVDKLRAELAVLRKHLVSKPAPGNTDAGATVDPGAGDPDAYTAVIEKQDELIDSLTVENTGLKEEIKLEHTSKLEWKAAYESEQKRSKSLELALDVQKSATKNALWKGRIQGGMAVGIPCGAYIVASKVFRF